MTFCVFSGMLWKDASYKMGGGGEEDEDIVFFCFLFKLKL